MDNDPGCQPVYPFSRLIAGLRCPRYLQHHSAIAGSCKMSDMRAPHPAGPPRHRCSGASADSGNGPLKAHLDPKFERGSRRSRYTQM
ncbi:hypothetical protein ACRALDRAFT_2037362, partial [Sodiomyces alcalophilus JCM 7366]|uniref:uncharacterized protein n=1 Tax=Sodiomyces alcalophilus JCM 7366 TaxID=591952 RepID=UPI0039B3807F